MKSMTGYGRGEARQDGLVIQIEVASVNRRSLEIQVSAPKEWLGLEQFLQPLVRNRATRGKVSIQVKVGGGAQEPHLQWDVARVRGALERLQSLADDAGIPFRPDAALLFEVLRQVQEENTLPNWNDLLPVIRAAADQALDQWDSMRQGEGAVLKHDLEQRLLMVKAMVTKMGGLAVDTAEGYRERLMERLRQSGLDLDVSDERVLKEITIYSDRCDLSEELTRLGSHLDLLESTMEESGTVGRKMDFILQEIYRELNTTGSKANNLEISRLVLQGKTEWERMREQAANVE